MRRIIVLVLCLMFVMPLYAGMPRALVDKTTNKILSWGYTDFEEKNGTYIVENIRLKQGENIEDGLQYIDGKVVKNPVFKDVRPTDKQKILDTLNITEEDIGNLKALKK